MKWGRKWGNLWGADSVLPLEITDFEELPPVVLAEWSSVSPDVLYHVYADGKFYDTTNATEILIQFQNFERHWIEVFVGGQGSMDEDLKAFLSTIPGTRIKISWTASTSLDIDHYDVYQKIAGVWTYLGRTKSVETCYITEILIDGTYEFRVDSVDEAGNTSVSALTKTQIVKRYPDPPSNLSLESFENDIASFNFDESTSSGVLGYRIYRGINVIDYEKVAETALAGTSSFDLMSWSSGTWRVGIRAYNAFYEEDNVDVYVEFELGGSPLAKLDAQPNTPLALSVKPAANGTFTMSCSYDAWEELGLGTQINFYANDGLEGEVNYLSTVGTAEIIEHSLGEQAIFEVSGTSISLIHDRNYTFVARATTTSGRESENSEEASGIADTGVPAEVSELVTETVNYEECDDDLEV